jgi:hypothetical protein
MTGIIYAVLREADIDASNQRENRGRGIDRRRRLV